MTFLGLFHMTFDFDPSLLCDHPLTHYSVHPSHLPILRNVYLGVEDCSANCFMHVLAHIITNRNKNYSGSAQKYSYI